ncbi:AroM family protein [Ketogulonicigenium vulgare]|uniref:AroM family protein n=1 Tax=Ketogulonicigenium vulgare TaxID=92945 RepID=UPI00235961B4|nr:AroM family protein [Ketogulonicigenium vulgare]
MSNRPTAVYFLTAGQSPRPDLIADVTRALPLPIAAHEIGALDGLSPAAIAALAPTGHEAQIMTFDAGGQWITLSKPRLAARMAAALAQVPVDQRPLVVILSTGLLGDFDTPFPTVNAQRALESTITALAETGEQIGIIQPLPHQAAHEAIPALSSYKVEKIAARMGDSTALEQAGRALSHCAFIVLNAVSYSAADADIVRAASGRRVLLARKIVASALQLLLSTRRAPGSDLAPDLLSGLTPRQRQVLPLMAEGLSSKLIARQLGISPKTVEIHRSQIMRRLNVRSVHELIFLIAAQRSAEGGI